VNRRTRPDQAAPRQQATLQAVPAATTSGNHAPAVGLARTLCPTASLPPHCRPKPDPSRGITAAAKPRPSRRRRKPPAKSQQSASKDEDSLMCPMCKAADVMRMLHCSNGGSRGRASLMRNKQPTSIAHRRADSSNNKKSIQEQIFQPAITQHNYIKINHLLYPTTTGERSMTTHQITAESRITFPNNDPRHQINYSVHQPLGNGASALKGTLQANINRNTINIAATAKYSLVDNRGNKYEVSGIYNPTNGDIILESGSTITFPNGETANATGRINLRTGTFAVKLSRTSKNGNSVLSVSQRSSTPPTIGVTQKFGGTAVSLEQNLGGGTPTITINHTIGPLSITGHNNGVGFRLQASQNLQLGAQINFDGVAEFRTQMKFNNI